MNEYLSPSKLDWTLALLHTGKPQRRVRMRIANSKHSANRRANRAGIAGRLYAVELLRLFNAAKWRCIYCGKPGLLTLDHVHPLIAGGGNSISNVIPCCNECNQRKSGAALNDWLATIHLSSEIFEFKRRQLFEKWGWYMFRAETS